jgi:hypothetical protein
LKEKISDFDENAVTEHLQENGYDDPLVISVAGQFEGGSLKEWKEFLDNAAKSAIRISVMSREDVEVILVGDRVKIGFEKDTVLFVVDNKIEKRVDNVSEKVLNTENPTLRDATLLAVTMYAACGLQEFYTMREPFIDWMGRVAKKIGLDGFDHERAVSVLKEFKSQDPFDYSYLLFGGGQDGTGKEIKVFGGLFGFNNHSIRCNGSGIDLLDYFPQEEYEKRENFTVMYWMGILALVGNGCFVDEHTVIMRLQPNMPAVPLVSQDNILDDLEKFEDNLCMVV